MSLFQELKRRNVFRVAAAYVAFSWLVIQVVETLFPLFGFSDAAARAVVIVLAIGFVPAVVVSWAFEWTPEGIRREAQVDHGAAVNVRLGKRLDRLIMLLLALGFAYLAFDKFILDPARDRQLVEQVRSESAPVSDFGNSIAVLAFDDLSPDGDMAWFAEGISEELLNVLTRVPDLRVAGRTSAFSFKGQQATTTEIGEALKVSYLLDGSVRMAADRLRISAKLLDARTDSQLWAESYDRQKGDLFEIQEEIATRVVERLQVSLFKPGAIPRETDPEAYALFLKARSLFNQWDFSQLPQIGALLERALEIDPDFVPALTLQARYYFHLARQSPMSWEEAHERIQRLIDRALAIDPNDGYALAWRAWFAMMVEGDMRTAARYSMRAHQADPYNFENLTTSVRTALFFGRADQAIRIGEYLLARDPLCLLCYTRLAFAYTVNGQLEEAENRLQSVLELEPGWDDAQAELAFEYIQTGRFGAAMALLEEIEEDNDWIRTGRIIALRSLGRMEAADTLFQQLKENSATPPAWLISMVHARSGEIDLAFEWIGRHDPAQLAVIRAHLVDPMFKPLHQDPRWLALLEKYEMSPAQLAELNFDLRLPEG